MISINTKSATKSCLRRNRNNGNNNDDNGGVYPNSKMIKGSSTSIVSDEEESSDGSCTIGDHHSNHCNMSNSNTSIENDPIVSPFATRSHLEITINVSKHLFKPHDWIDSNICITDSPFIIAAAVSAAPCNNVHNRPKGKKKKSHNDPKMQKDGRWTSTEHELFLYGMALHGHRWCKVAKYIPTRSSTQVRSHAQKYFQSKLYSHPTSPPSNPNNKEWFYRHHQPITKSSFTPAPSIMTSKVLNKQHLQQTLPEIEKRKDILIQSLLMEPKFQNDNKQGQEKQPSLSLNPMEGYGPPKCELNKHQPFNPTSSIHPTKNNNTDRNDAMVVASALLSLSTVVDQQQPQQQSLPYVKNIDLTMNHLKKNQPVAVEHGVMDMALTTIAKHLNDFDDQIHDIKTRGSKRKRHDSIDNENDVKLIQKDLVMDSSTTTTMTSITSSTGSVDQTLTLFPPTHERVETIGEHVVVDNPNDLDDDNTSKNLMNDSIHNVNHCYHILSSMRSVSSSSGEVTDPMDEDDVPVTGKEMTKATTTTTKSNTTTSSTEATTTTTTITTQPFSPPSTTTTSTSSSPQPEELQIIMIRLYERYFHLCQQQLHQKKE
jgi:SHAQKYF class myb-like DNA-binding protein